MENWVQEFLYNDVRVLLSCAALFVGLLVFVLLVVGLRSHRRTTKGVARKVAGEVSEDGGKYSLVGAVDVVPATATVSEVGVALAPVDEKAIHHVPESRNELVEKLNNLEQGGNALAVAQLCNEVADMAFDQADMDQAREFCVKGLTKAALVDAPELQAVSRLMLGDISKIEGDLTTACEHWQLARELFTDCNDTEKVAEAEIRMRDNQCPTDWVLNEF